MVARIGLALFAFIVNEKATDDGNISSSSSASGSCCDGPAVLTPLSSHNVLNVNVNANTATITIASQTVQVSKNSKFPFSELGNNGRAVCCCFSKYLPTLQSFPWHHQGLYQVRRRIPCVTTSGHWTNYLEMLFLCEVDVVTNEFSHCVVVRCDCCHWLVEEPCKLINTLVSPEKLTELEKNPLTNQLTERRRRGLVLWSSPFVT